MHRIHGASPSGIARQAVPQYVPQPAQFCSSEACAPSHPTCLIASSVLRSAFARSIRNPFSRLVPGALLDMQQKSVKPSRPTLLHILAHIPRQRPAVMGRGRIRGSFQPSRASTSYPHALCSAKSRLHRFPCLVRNGCGKHSFDRHRHRHRRPWQAMAVAGSSSRSRLAPLPKASPPPVSHRSAWRTPGSQAFLWSARGIPYRCQWDENLPD